MGKAGRAKKGLPEIVFDDAARCDFITGFHKRKNERRQHARRRIEREVKADKLQERQEKREAMREVRGIGASAPEPGDDGGAASASDDDAEPAGAEVASFIFQDTLTTTSVTPLLEEPEPAPEARRGGGGEGRGGADADARPKKLKKFNLSQPLANAIPGYKPAKGLKKARKVKKKKKVVSKKEKARGRNPKQQQR